MRLFLFTMALAGISFFAECAGMELGASTISFVEMPTQESSTMLPDESQSRATKAGSEGIYDEAFGSDSFGVTRGLGEKLDLLMRELKTFVHANQFDSAGFYLRVDSLYSQLTYIRDSAGVVSPFQGTLQSTLCAQIWYVTNVFYFLIDSAEMLDVYFAADGPAHKAVAGLIILNMKLMRLFDSRGQPIPSRRDYVNTVARLAMRKKKLEEKFSGLKVPESIRRAFDFYGARADDSLSTLAQIIPHFEV